MPDTQVKEEIYALTEKEKDRLRFIKWLTYDTRPPGYTDYVYRSPVPKPTAPCRSGTGDE